MKRKAKKKNICQLSFNNDENPFVKRVIKFFHGDIYYMSQMLGQPPWIAKILKNSVLQSEDVKHTIEF